MITVAILLTFVIGVVAFALNIGYRHVTRNELQNIADGAALAASRQLGVIYRDMTPATQQTYNPSTDDGDENGTTDEVQIVGVALDVGTRNTAAKKSITIDPTYVDPVTTFNDVAIGTWSGGTFTQGYIHPNAVRVTVRRDNVANSPITTFFAGIFNIVTMNVTASAVAALTGQGTATEGELELPVAIDSCWFSTDCNPTGTGANCGSEIKFYPTSSCAGWTGFDENVTTPHMLDLVNGVDENPVIIAGDGTDWFFGGGVNAAVFPDLIDLFKRKGWDVDSSDEPIQNFYDVDGITLMHAIPPGSGVGEQPLCLYKPDILDKDTWYREVCDSGSSVVQENLYWPDGQGMNKHHWSTTVVVYESNDCGNPVQTMKIVGFAKILITYIGGAPEKNIVGELECDSVSPDDSRGGGGDAYGGLMGSIPGLVQ